MHSSSSSHVRRGLFEGPAALLILVVEGCHPSTADATSAPSRLAEAAATDAAAAASSGAVTPATTSGAPITPAADTSAPVTPGPAASAGHCRPSSVSQGATCPRRAVPPGTGSSPEGCKSDADCKGGHDGRCVGNVGTENTSPVRSNLFAAPPTRPPRSLCVYDECLSDKECGAHKRCVCRSGVGMDRNECVAADACLIDKGCEEKETLCVCGEGGLANVCYPSNCRTDADCRDGRECAADSHGGRYCRTARDTCRTDGDCKPPSPGAGAWNCVYDVTSRLRACKLIPPIPPG